MQIFDGTGYKPLGYSAIPPPSTLADALSSQCVITVSSADRDETQYPDAAHCKITLPTAFEGISYVRLLSAEVPHVSPNITNAKLFFSEKTNGAHFFFEATIPSGGYDVDALGSAIVRAMHAAVSVTDRVSRPLNTYAYQVSDTGFAIVANGECEFALHFRKDPVEIIDVKRAVEGVEFLELTVKDNEVRPLCAGAVVTLRCDKDYQCIITDAAGATVVLKRLDEEIISYNATLDVSYVTYLSPGQWDLQLVEGATLVPASAYSQNLGDALGYGSIADISSADSSIPIKSISPPFTSTTEEILIAGSSFHFLSSGDRVKIEGTDTFLDGIQEVVNVPDPFGFTVTPNFDAFVASAPSIVLNDTIVRVVSLEKQTCSNGRMNAALQLNRDTTGLEGQTFFFAVNATSDKAVYKQWLGASGIVVSSDGAQGITATITMPSKVFVDCASATFSVVASSGITTCAPSPGRFDLSRGKRFIFVALSLDDRPIGALYAPGITAKLFARLPLSSGRDAVNFIAESEIFGEALPSVPSAKIRTLILTVYGEDGQLYNFENTDYSLTVLMKVTSPLQ